MKRLIFLFAVLPVCALPAGPQILPIDDTARSGRALQRSGQPASQVSFEATVTYYARNLNGLDVQDGDVAIYVVSPKDAVLVPAIASWWKEQRNQVFCPLW